MVLTGSIFYKKIEDLKDIQEVVLFQEKIWGGNTATPLSQLVAACHHGGVLIGAYDASKLVGFAYGFPGFKNNQSYMVSHMAGVLDEYHNQGIGTALKLKQREWALAYGYKKIVWTYDPLEARNAYFNLMKLGAYARTFIPSYYGEMNDKLNQGLPTDRLLVEWEICSNRVENTLNGLSRSGQEEQMYTQLIETTLINDRPYPLESRPIEKAKGYLLAVPANFQDIKKTDIEAAKVWRKIIGHVLGEVLAHGYAATGIIKNSDNLVHSYIIEQIPLEVSS